MRITPSRGDQDKGSLNDEEKEEEELERSSSAVIVARDPLLFGDGDEAIASTRGYLVSLQEVPKDITYKYEERHVSMLIENKKKQWRKCVPTLNTILGTHTVIYLSLVINNFDTNEMLGVHGLLITFEEDTIDCDILQRVGGDEKEGQHIVIGNIYTHHFQDVYA